MIFVFFLLETVVLGKGTVFDPGILPGIVQSGSSKGFRVDSADRDLAFG